jgi:hypothetical protein
MLHESLEPFAEHFRMIPHPAEQDGNVPNPSESFGMFPHLAERKANHTLTVREVARMFEHAGVARTERSIINWCQPNKHGIARLDCYYDHNEHKYFITPESAVLAIKEEQAKSTGDHGGESPVTAHDLPKRAEGPAAHTTATAEESTHTAGYTPSRVKELEAELRDVSIASGVKEKYIERLEAENDALREDRQKYIDQVIAVNRLAGQLEGLLNLPTLTVKKLKVRSFEETGALQNDEVTPLHHAAHQESSPAAMPPLPPHDVPPSKMDFYLE